MAQRKVKCGRIRLSGPIIGLVAAVFSALTFGVAQSQIAVDAVPWVEAVIESARGIVLPGPVHPTRPANLPVAPRPVFTPGDTPPRLPHPPPDIVLPAIPEAPDAVPLTPYGRGALRSGRAVTDDPNLCTASCQEPFNAGLRRCEGGSEAVPGEAEASPTPGMPCRVALREIYRSCLLTQCGLVLPEPKPGTLPPPPQQPPVILRPVDLRP